jgi:ankyrin repeat protein
MASKAKRELCRAAERDDIAAMQRLIAEGADPNSLVDDWTPLQWAAYNGHPAAIAALLAAGARVDGADSIGYKPLMYAADMGHAVAIDALLAAGADVNHASSDGDTALHLASLKGPLDGARVLVEAGARTDVRNHDGEHPIDVVRLCGGHRLAAAEHLCFAATAPCAGVPCDQQQSQRGTPA